MRVGVISDTHNPSVGDEPPPEVVSGFDGVDVIIHAGDIVPTFVPGLAGEDRASLRCRVGRRRPFQRGCPSGGHGTGAGPGLSNRHLHTF